MQSKSLVSGSVSLLLVVSAWLFRNVITMIIEGIKCRWYNNAMCLRSTEGEIYYSAFRAIPYIVALFEFRIAGRCGGGIFVYVHLNNVIQ